MAKMGKMWPKQKSETIHTEIMQKKIMNQQYNTLTEDGENIIKTCHINNIYLDDPKIMLRAVEDWGDLGRFSNSC